MQSAVSMGGSDFFGDDRSVRLTGPFVCCSDHSVHFLFRLFEAHTVPSIIKLMSGHRAVPTVIERSSNDTS